jgi:hypothetical protein
MAVGANARLLRATAVDARADIADIQQIETDTEV